MWPGKDVNLALGSLRLLLLASCGVALTQCRTEPPSPFTPLPPLAPTPAAIMPTLQLETQILAQAIVYVLSIPATDPVTVEFAPAPQPITTFATQPGVIAVLNAGFFDPQNGQTTSYGVIAGATIADPTTNERLIHNPKLSPFLDQILNRSEFRRYDCAGTIRYDITPHATAVPAGCTLNAAVGAGPQLLPENTAEPEAFIDYDATGQLIRDAIGTTQRNARSAIGIRADGTLVWVMVAQKTDIPTNSGMTLTELTTFMQQLNVQKALNLDGGSSSSIVFKDTAYYGRLTPEGHSVQRPIKSVLMITK